MTPELKEMLLSPMGQYYIAATLILFPFLRIFRRADLRFWWVGLLAVPMVGYILCAAVLALRRWPVLPVSPAAGKREKA